MGHGSRVADTPCSDPGTMRLAGLREAETVWLRVLSAEAPAQAFLTKALNYFSMTNSKLLNTCDVCPKEVCQIQCG